MVLINSMKFKFLLILFFSFYLSQIVSDKEIQPQNNNYIPAYDFTLQLLVEDDKDSLFNLSSLKGNVILINFWATWCGPCIAEIPEFNHLRKKYNSQKFEVLGISVNDSKNQLKKFIKKFDVDYPILFGSLDEMNPVIYNYGGFNSVPVSYLINRDGMVVKGYPGAIIGQYWTNLLENDIMEFLSDSIKVQNNQ